jgi:hypothetical protein
MPESKSTAENTSAVQHMHVRIMLRAPAERERLSDCMRDLPGYEEWVTKALSSDNPHLHVRLSAEDAAGLRIATQSSGPREAARSEAVDLQCQLIAANCLRYYTLITLVSATSKTRST